MKKILILVIIILLLGGTGYYLYSTTMKPSKGGSASGGMFASIKDALSRSLSLQCSFVSDDGTKVTAYLKAGSVRADNEAKDPQQSGSYIMKDKKLYFWQKDSKQGTMMTMIEPSVTPGKMQTAQEVSPTGSSQDNQGDTILSMLEKFKNSCRPAVIADSLFTPPSEVTFTDLSKMMPTIPTGQPSSEDVQKMIQQYQQSSGQ